MTTTVGDDFREFVAARWPELESVALVVLLDPDRARSVTAGALAALSRRWQDTLDAGRPGEAARRAVLTAALAAAPATTTANAATTTGDDSTNRSHLPHPEPGDDVTYWSNPSHAEPDEDPVVAALVDAIRSAPPIERALLAATVLWGCSPDEVAHLLDLPGGSVGEHAASLDARLVAAHDAARAAAGLEPSPWSRERDVRDAVDEVLHGQGDPPDPAALVADRAVRARRRTLVAGGVAMAALAGAGAVLARRTTSTRSDLAPNAAPGVEDLAPDDPRWASVALWPARGPLVGDPGVASLVTRAGGPRDRILWAGDVDTQRLVLALTYTPEQGDLSGTSTEPLLRAHLGPRGIDPARLETVPLQLTGSVNSNGVVAAVLPGGLDSGRRQSLLIVLARPTEVAASLSQVVRPRPDGSADRSWSSLPLVGGVATTTLDTPLPLAARLRVGTWEGPPDSFTASFEVLRYGPTPSTSPDWAEAHISALTGIPEERLSSTVFIDEEVPRGLLDWPPPPGADPARLVSLLTTTPDGAVVRTTAYHGEDFVWPLEPAHVFAAGSERDPLVVWGSDQREGLSRFLVVAPGADRVQLISTSPDGYPVSKVQTTNGRDAVVVPVVNGRAAADYRVIVKDATGQVLFDGVPSPGRSLAEL